jgi:hypothetical protein
MTSVFWNAEVNLTERSCHNAIVTRLGVRQFIPDNALIIAVLRTPGEADIRRLPMSRLQCRGLGIRGRISLDRRSRKAREVRLHLVEGE